MSLLTAAQNAMRAIGVVPPVTMVDSTEEIALLLLAQLYELGFDLRSDYCWPQLNRLHSITLESGTDIYALPDDLDYQNAETVWNRTTTQPVFGPLTPKEWRALAESGALASAPTDRYRIAGFSSGEFQIQPTPGAGDAGNIIVLEYQSTQWFRPITWVAGTPFDAGSYCYYQGNTYKTTAGGTTGATPPTHTSGADSDDNVTWTYQDSYDSFSADSDLFLLPQQLVERGLQWKFKTAKGFVGADKLEKSFRNLCDVRLAAITGLRTLSLSRGGGSGFLNRYNIPEQNF